MCCADSSSSTSSPKLTSKSTASLMVCYLLHVSCDVSIHYIRAGTIDLTPDTLVKVVSQQVFKIKTPERSFILRCEGLEVCKNPFA